MVRHIDRLIEFINEMEHLGTVERQVLLTRVEHPPNQAEIIAAHKKLDSAWDEAPDPEPEEAAEPQPPAVVVGEPFAAPPQGFVYGHHEGTMADHDEAICRHCGTKIIYLRPGDW